MTASLELDRRTVVARTVEDHHRCAFTLVEALVVIAIIGGLLVLLMPALQNSREASRQVTCKQRLREIGLAVIQYDNAHSHLPPGHLGPPQAGDPASSAPGGYAQNVGVTTFLLPFLERPSEWERVGVSLDIGVWPNVDQRNGVVPFFQDEGTWGLAQTPVPELLCPSTDASASSLEVIVILNTMNCGLLCADLQKLDWPDQEVALRLGRTNYLAVAGVFGRLSNEHRGKNEWDRFEGAFWNRSQVRLQQVTDGLSKTLLWGEVVGGWNADRTRSHSYAWLSVGALPTYWGLKPSSGHHVTDWAQFSSEHTGITHFCYGDGAVRLTNNSIETEVFHALSGISDGQVVAENELP